jgi:hypothetical protein
MNRTANVTSIEKVNDFRTRLCEFGAKARETLASIDMYNQRTVDWLVNQHKFWHHEIKVRQEELVRAKIELERRKNMSKEGRGPGTADHEKNFRKAQARLKEAEDKLANCKQWRPLLEHALREYQGPARSFGGALDSDLLKAIAFLERKLLALEGYLKLTPPSVPQPEPLGAAQEAAPTAAELASAGQDQPADTPAPVQAGKMHQLSHAPAAPSIPRTQDGPGRDHS